MVEIKQQLSKKDISNILLLMDATYDLYGDFYLTKNNIRLFIRDNTHLLFDNLKKGDKIVFDEKGLVFITGWSDKNPRKYIKILSPDEKVLDSLLKMINWNVDTDLYVKLKKENPAIRVLKQNRWKFFGDRGKEVLLVKRVFKNQGEYNANRNENQN